MAMGNLNLKLPRSQVAEFCRLNHICKLSLFGSVLGEEFRPDSDVDILVEFEPGETPGLLGMAALELELSELVGRKVDLRTPSELSRYFRESVMEQAEVQYVQG